MPLFFRNNTPNTIDVAIAYPDPNCSPITYTKAGWYNVPPGRTVNVRQFAANMTLYWYAEDTEGNVWSGPYFTSVPDDRFNMCWIENCTPCQRVGFQQVRTDFRYYFTITLVLSSSRRKSKSGSIFIAPTKRKLKFRKYPYGTIKKAKSQRKRKSANIRMILPRETERKR